MIAVVSFDYFPITDYVDFGFTETDSWNIRFEWLGYETINFVEGMGSLIIFAFMGIIYAIIVFLLCFDRCLSRLKSERVRVCCSR